MILKNRSLCNVSRLMLMRDRPAAFRSSAISRSVAPFVVNAMSMFLPASGDFAVLGTLSWASFSTNIGRCARTVGSPPVKRMLSTSNRCTQIVASRSISSKVKIWSRSSHVMPSSGMQYVQRKLQRSVIEIRKSRTVRPNGSINSTKIPRQQLH